MAHFVRSKKRKKESYPSFALQRQKGDLAYKKGSFAVYPFLFISSNYDIRLSLTGEKDITKSVPKTLESGGSYGRAREEKGRAIFAGMDLRRYRWPMS